MNILAKLTLRHLRENRKRTAVTILGIAMATALISAILLGVFSFFKFSAVQILLLSFGSFLGVFQALGVVLGFGGCFRLLECVLVGKKKKHRFLPVRI